MGKTDGPNLFENKSNPGLTFNSGNTDSMKLIGGNPGQQITPLSNNPGQNPNLTGNKPGDESAIIRFSKYRTRKNS